MKRTMFAVCLMMLACGPSNPMFSSLPLDQREQVQTYTFDRPFAAVYQACYDALSGAGFEVTMYDSPSDMVATEFMEISDTPMSIGNTEDARMRPIRAKVSAKVIAVDLASTRVKLDVVLQYKPPSWQELPRNVEQMRRVYSKYFSLIQAQLPE